MSIDGILKGQNTKLYNLYVLLLFVIIGFVIYSNSFSVPFHLDDTAQIQLSKDTKSLDSYKDFWYWTDFISNRPLSKFSLALNYQVHKDDVFGFHLLNLFIHILASFCVFLFIREILQSPVLRNERFQTNGKLFALAVALLFLVHPIQTQSVTYIVQRMTSMAGLFYVLSCYLYLKARYAHADQQKSAYRLYILAVLSGILALYSKQNAITFPAAWLLIEFFFVRKQDDKIFKKYLISGVSFLVLAFLIVIIFGWLPRETEKISRLEYLMTQFTVFKKYIQLSFIPVGQNIDHDFPVSAGMGMREIFGLLSILIVLGAGVWSFRKYRLISFGIFWFFLTISVTSGIIPIQDVMFEHRLYLPVLGMILIIITLLFRLMPQKNVKPFALIVLIIVLVFSGLTYARNDLWTSGYKLWSDAYKKSPGKPRVQQNLGLSYIHKADYRNALRMFDKVIASDPEHYNARFNRGNIRLRFQDYQGAIDDLEVFIRKYPKTLQAWQGLGKAHLELGNYDQAEKAYSRMIELDEDNALAHFERGRTRMMKKQYGSALEDFFIAKELNPTNAAIYNIIGQIHTYLDQKEKALDYFGQAIDIAPDYARAYFNRGYIFAGEHNIQAALDDLNKAIENDPRIYEAYKARGLVLYWNREYEKAYQDLTTASQAGIAVPPGLMQEIHTKLNMR